MRSIAEEFMKIEIPADEIKKKRASIASLFIEKSANVKSSYITSISAYDLRILYEIYDKVFLQDWFRRNYKGKMKFSLSGRMTKSAGKTICPKNISSMEPEKVVLEIRIGIDFFLGRGHLATGCNVCGLETGSSLEALLLVFEHEICHALEILLFGKSSCRGERFKKMAANLFGHKESSHKMPTNRQIAQSVFGFSVGDSVSFKYKEKQLRGLLYNIKKRAVVIVPDKNGQLIDREGVRYSKYYVPLKMLTTVK